MDIKIEKYICNRCGVEVVCRDWSIVVRREKKCIECCEEVPMSEATLKRIAIKEGTYAPPLKHQATKKFNKTPQQPVSLRREDKPKSKKERARNQAAIDKRHRFNALKNSYKEQYRSQFEVD